MNFYKHYLGDYLRDTADLSLVEHGAYRLMLDYYYSSEKPLPVDAQAVCRILRASSRTERDAVATILARFWVKTESGYINRRAFMEIEKSLQQRAINAEIGKRGGRPKRTEQRTDSVSESEPNRNPNQTPDTRHQTKEKIKTNARAAPALIVLPDWIPADAWAAYAEHRKASKKPLTQAGADLAIRKLGEFRTQGFSPQLVLETAVMNGWTGLYAPKQQPAQSRQSALEARNAQVAANWIPPELRTANATE